MVVLLNSRLESNKEEEEDGAAVGTTAEEGDGNNLRGIDFYLDNISSHGLGCHLCAICAMFARKPIDPTVCVYRGTSLIRNCPPRLGPP